MLNEGCRYSETIRGRSAGCGVLDYLAATWPHSTRDEWAQRIAAGLVLLDGRPATASTPLEAGQELVWDRPPWEEPEVPLHFEVLFADDALLVVDKPAGLPTLPAGGEYLQHTLLHQVRLQHGEVSPVHRLDRGTSGVVVFARDRAAASALGRRWRAEATKLYRARLAVAPSWRDIEIDAPIGTVPHPLQGRVAAAHPDGRAARTRVRRVREADPALVEIELLTGRPHQIRIHLASIGAPLLGEPFYGPAGQPIEGGSARVGDIGFRLHAWRVAMPHPSTDEALEVSAPLPDWAT